MTRKLVLICLVTAAWAFSFGLGSQVVTHWLKHHGASNSVIGLNHATHYLGLALGSLAAPWLMRGLGSRSCAALGQAWCALSLLLFPWGGDLGGWFVLRLVNGLASALTLIPLETWISQGARPEERTRSFGFYGVSLTLGGALGIWSGLHFYRPESLLPFFLGSACPLLGSLLLWRGFTATNPGAEGPKTDSTASPAQRFLSYGTAWGQGFLEGGMLAFLSLYLISIGISADGAGTLMGLTMAGVIAFQVPVAWLADRLGKTPVLMGCYLVVLAGLTAVPLHGPGVMLGMWLFAIGACSGAMYPLGLSLLGEQQGHDRLARAYAWYLAMECLGSQAGAAVMGQARDLWGEAGMFPVGIVALLIVLVPYLGVVGYPRFAARIHELLRAARPM